MGTKGGGYRKPSTYFSASPRGRDRQGEPWRLGSSSPLRKEHPFHPSFSTNLPVFTPGGGGSFSSQAPMRWGGEGQQGGWGWSPRWALPTALLSVVLKSKWLVYCALRGAETPLGQLRCAVVASARRHPSSSSPSSSSFSSSSSASCSSFSSSSSKSSSSSSSSSFSSPPSPQCPEKREAKAPFLGLTGILPKASASPPPFDAARKMPSHWRWKGEQWGGGNSSFCWLGAGPVGFFQRAGCPLLPPGGNASGILAPLWIRDWRSGETPGEKLAS
ncbi:hypothetical protein E2320_013917 [Naja naja]|nr:hypothetical protein E2320_013917 [Naja naja]